MKAQKTLIQLFLDGKTVYTHDTHTNKEGETSITTERQTFRVSKYREKIWETRSDGYQYSTGRTKSSYRIGVSVVMLHSPDGRGCDKNAPIVPLDERTGYGIGLGGWKTDEEALKLWNRIQSKNLHPSRLLSN